MGGTSKTHQRILDAALAVLRREGLAGTTTKEIAAAAGLSEAALYRHFADKEALLVAVVLDNLPRLGGTLHRTDDLELEAALREVALGALAYMLDLGPLFLSMLADPDLARKMLKSAQVRGVAPASFHETLAAWIGERPELADAAPGFADMVALLLFGACSHYAWMARFSDGNELPTPQGFTDVLAAGLTDMIAGLAGQIDVPRGVRRDKP